MSNDRFKFRAWKNGKMHYGIEGHTIEDNELSGPEGDVIDLSTWIKYYPVMQSTGLKDKNGKLIYEGDILRCDWDDTRYPPHNIGPVYWDEENVCFLLGEGGSPYYDAESFMEVIGNICENHELLLLEDE